MLPIIEEEQQRIVIQNKIDKSKTQDERNRMGQFATPTLLAQEILFYVKNLIPSSRQISFLDPCIGTGSFYSALLHTFPASQIKTAEGFEIDPLYGIPAKKLWLEKGLKIHLDDFTKQSPPKQGFNLVICNPPYVRHHHIAKDDKARIRCKSSEACGVSFSGLSGLYCYFIGLTHSWMEEGGLAGWLIPSEFMDVNYGKAIKEYLLDEVLLLHIHRFDPKDVQFKDALVSSAIIWFKKEKPPKNHEVKFSFGGSLLNPNESRFISSENLRIGKKWTHFPSNRIHTNDNGPKLNDYFTIKRGLATGDNSYFILTKKQIEERNLPIEFFKPILPSPRYLPHTEIISDSDGNPIIENSLFLLDCHLPEKEIQINFPSLWVYLQEGYDRGIPNRYLCKHRSPWYSQEDRPAPLFVCTYMGREKGSQSKPFRFIFNQSLATVTNAYLALYPKDNIVKILNSDKEYLRHVWKLLNAIDSQDLLSEGRVYGGGLMKIEPKELLNVKAIKLAKYFSSLK